MPARDLDELLLLNENMDANEKLCEDTLRERFDIVGGIPRNIFVSETEWEKVLLQLTIAVKQIKLQDIINRVECVAGLLR